MKASEARKRANRNKRNNQYDSVIVEIAAASGDGETSKSFVGLTESTKAKLREDEYELSEPRTDRCSDPRDQFVTTVRW